MNHTTTKIDQSSVETAKGGGCCGGNKASQGIDAPAAPQASVKAPAARSGRYCCS